MLLRRDSRLVHGSTSTASRCTRSIATAWCAPISAPPIRSRAPNPFTGFDEATITRMHRTVAPSGNAALAAVPRRQHRTQCRRLERLAWQERKAEPFTATPLHCGTATFSGSAHSLGYRRIRRHAANGGITLGTALAISGAAASPNMGYHSSPIGHAAAGAVQRAARLVARQSGRARRGDLSVATGPRSRSCRSSSRCSG